LIWHKTERSSERREIAPTRLLMTSFTHIARVGVDDWALRRGRSYGTLVIDLERRHAVDGHCQDNWSASWLAWCAIRGA